jgi:hypothetical protein
VVEIQARDTIAPGRCRKAVERRNRGVWPLWQLRLRDCAVRYKDTPICGSYVHHPSPARPAIVTLWTHDLSKSRKLKPKTAAWYPKAVLTFSDTIAAVRREIWGHQISFISPRVARNRRSSVPLRRPRDRG